MHGGKSIVYKVYHVCLGKALLFKLRSDLDQKSSSISRLRFGLPASSSLCPRQNCMAARQKP